jgi:hypothetical protein
VLSQEKETCIRHTNTDRGTLYLSLYRVGLSAMKFLVSVFTVFVNVDAGFQMSGIADWFTGILFACAGNLAGPTKPPEQ